MSLSIAQQTILRWKQNQVLWALDGLTFEQYLNEETSDRPTVKVYWIAQLWEWQAWRFPDNSMIVREGDGTHGWFNPEGLPRKEIYGEEVIVYNG